MKNNLINLDYFKEGRDYIQGPDIYNQITINYLNNNQFIKSINFKKLIKTVPIITINDNENFSENLNADIASFGEIEDITNFKSYSFYLYESNIQIKKKLPYNEELMIKNFIIENHKDMIHFESKNKYNFSTLEVIISMKKLLCQTLFGKNKKWIFTSFKASGKLNSKFSIIKIKIKKNIKESFISSEVFIDEQNVASITFLGKYE